jgi:hypothetical protein
MLNTSLKLCYRRGELERVRECVKGGGELEMKRGRGGERDREREL